MSLALTPAGVRALEAASGQGVAALVDGFARRAWRATDVCAALALAGGASAEDVDRLAAEIGLARAAALVLALLERALAGEGRPEAGMTRAEFEALKARFPDGRNAP
jgi:hypothetical protein